MSSIGSGTSAPHTEIGGTEVPLPQNSKMGEWRECKLGDILELKYGKDHKALSDETDNFVKLIFYPPIPA